MPTGYQIKDQQAAYFVTVQVVHWADIFSRKIYRDIVIESLDYCGKHKGLEHICLCDHEQSFTFDGSKQKWQAQRNNYGF